MSMVRWPCSGQASEHPPECETLINLGFLHAMAGTVGVRLPDDEVD